MMAAGNESAGDWVRYFNDWVEEMKAYDNSRIYQPFLYQTSSKGKLVH